MIIVAKSPEDKEVARAFMQAHGVNISKSDDFNAIGRINAEGKLMGVVVYNGFNGMCCSMHNAGDGNWISREFLKVAFHYPFVECDLNHIIVTVAGDNARALKLDKHLGFRVLFRIPHGWAKGVDTVILGMARHECRWIEQEKQRELKIA
jgi:RimJ/RimL family protein N-acetyltransferase